MYVRAFLFTCVCACVRAYVCMRECVYAHVITYTYVCSYIRIDVHIKGKTVCKKREIEKMYIPA